MIQTINIIGTVTARTGLIAAGVGIGLVFGALILEVAFLGVGLNLTASVV